MPLAQLICSAARLDAPAGASVEQTLHAMVVLPAANTLPRQLPGAEQLLAVLKRRDVKLETLAKTPQAIDLPGGGRYAFVMVDDAQPRYAQLTVLRKAALLLLEEAPRELHLALCGADGQGALQLAREALYVLWLNGATLPHARRSRPSRCAGSCCMVISARPSSARSLRWRKPIRWHAN